MSRPSGVPGSPPASMASGANRLFQISVGENSTSADASRTSPRFSVGTGGGDADVSLLPVESSAASVRSHGSSFSSGRPASATEHHDPSWDVAFSKAVSSMSVGAPDTPFPQRREFSVASPSVLSLHSLRELRTVDGEDRGHVDVEGPAVSHLVDIVDDISDRRSDLLSGTSVESPGPTQAQPRKSTGPNTRSSRGGWVALTAVLKVVQAAASSGVITPVQKGYLKQAVLDLVFNDSSACCEEPAMPSSCRCRCHTGAESVALAKPFRGPSSVDARTGGSRAHYDSFSRRDAEQLSKPGEEEEEEEDVGHDEDEDDQHSISLGPHDGDEDLDDEGEDRGHHDGDDHMDAVTLEDDLHIEHDDGDEHASDMVSVHQDDGAGPDNPNHDFEVHEGFSELSEVSVRGQRYPGALPGVTQDDSATVTSLRPAPARSMAPSLGSDSDGGGDSSDAADNDAAEPAMEPASRFMFEQPDRAPTGSGRNNNSSSNADLHLSDWEEVGSEDVGSAVSSHRRLEEAVENDRIRLRVAADAGSTSSLGGSEQATAGGSVVNDLGSAGTRLRGNQRRSRGPFSVMSAVSNSTADVASIECRPRSPGDTSSNLAARRRVYRPPTLAFGGPRGARRVPEGANVPRASVQVGVGGPRAQYGWHPARATRSSTDSVSLLSLLYHGPDESRRAAMAAGDADSAVAVISAPRSRSRRLAPAITSDTSSIGSDASPSNDGVDEHVLRVSTFLPEADTPRVRWPDTESVEVALSTISEADTLSALADDALSLKASVVPSSTKSELDGGSSSAALSQHALPPSSVNPSSDVHLFSMRSVRQRIADEAKLRASSRLPAPSLQLELEAQDSVESEGGVVDDDYDEYDYGDSDSDDALAPAPPSAQPVASGAGAPPRPSGRARRPIASSRLQRQMYKTRSPSVPSWAEKVKMDEDLKDGIPRL